LDYAVAVLVFASAAAALLSANDVGYRLKSMLIVVVGVVLYGMGRPRALWTFAAFMVSAWLTLFLHWGEPWQRRLGLAGQLVVGVIGLVWCARLLREELRRAEPDANAP
jgi:hypothetical protein